jgi:sulfite exporter TauE/SafE
MSALVVAAAAAGLLGGVHCAGMCGGIVASLSVSARGPLAARQLAFNAGRIASYATAGAVVGATGSFIGMAGPAFAAQTALFVVANVLMVLLGLYIAGWGRAVLRLESAGRGLWRRVEPVARRLFPVDTTRKALAAGALWGWVPCGLVYSMLALALASGSALSGAAVMAAFGLATLPTLLVAGFAAQRIASLRKSPWLRYSAGMAIIALGIVGLARVPGLHDAVLNGLACFS